MYAAISQIDDGLKQNVESALGDDGLEGRDLVAGIVQHLFVAAGQFIDGEVAVRFRELVDGVKQRPRVIGLGHLALKVDRRPADLQAFALRVGFFGLRRNGLL